MDHSIEDQFEIFVSEAIDRIPEQYQEKMKSVAILVADEPTPTQKQKLHMRHGASLFGLYEGVPLPKRGGAVYTLTPDIITIFKYPMIHIFQDSVALKQQIFETLWHEVAHYFGLDHEQIDNIKKRQKYS